MSADFQLCRALLASLGCKEQPKFITVHGEPRSKARPRFGGGGRVYSDRKQRDNELYLKWHFKDAIKSPFTCSVAVICVFYRSSRRRIDIDNMLKQILDAANQVCWLDDMQVVAISALLRMDRENPHTVVAIAEHKTDPHSQLLDRSDQDISATCVECGKGFTWRSYPSSSQKGLFCSVKCKNNQKRFDLRAPANCVACGKKFQRQYVAQRICSDRCRRKKLSATNKVGARPPAFCKLCGSKVSRPEYRRCRRCFLEGSKEGASL